MTTIAERQRIQREGAHSKALLEDALTGEFMDRRVSNCLAEFCSMPQFDARKAENIYHAIKAIEILRSEWKTAIGNAEMDKQHEKHEQTLRQRDY